MSIERVSTYSPPSAPDGGQIGSALRFVARQNVFDPPVCWDLETPEARTFAVVITPIKDLEGYLTGLVVVLFPFAAIGGGLLAVTTGGGAVLGALAGHAAAGMSRKDLKELGEHLDAGQAGLVVVAVSDMGAEVERAMKQARKIEARHLTADTAAIEADAKSAQV